MKTRWKLFAIVAVFATLVGCSPLHHRLHGTAFPESGAEVITLEFRGPDKRYPVVDVRIGDRQYQLLLDTGHFAPISLSPSALEKLELGVSSFTTYRGPFGRTYFARQFVVPLLEIGSLRLRNLYGVENLSGPAEFDGAIGKAFLEYFSVVVDYGRKLLVLYPKGDRPRFLYDGGWKAYAYREGLEVQLPDSDIKHKMSLDTGAGVTFISRNSPLGRQVLNRLHDWETVEPKRRLRRRGALVSDSCRLHINRRDLGANTCILLDLPQYMGNGSLGFDFFSHNAVFWDFGRGTIWLKRYR